MGDLPAIYEVLGDGGERAGVASAEGGQVGASGSEVVDVADEQPLVGHVPDHDASVGAGDVERDRTGRPMDVEGAAVAFALFDDVLHSHSGFGGFGFGGGRGHRRRDGRRGGRCGDRCLRLFGRCGSLALHLSCRHCRGGRGRGLRLSGRLRICACAGDEGRQQQDGTN